MFASMIQLAGAFFLLLPTFKVGRRRTEAILTCLGTVFVSPCSFMFSGRVKIFCLVPVEISELMAKSDQIMKKGLVKRHITHKIHFIVVFNQT